MPSEINDEAIAHPFRYPSTMT